MPRSLELQWRIMRGTAAAFGLLLVAATWRLWTPQSVFPQVPLWRPAGMMPRWCEWTLLGALLVSQAVALLQAGSGRSGSTLPSLWAFVLAAGGLVLVDQHRLQPWMYQLVLIALVIQSDRPARGLWLVRCLTISIYVYSAAGKFDYQFLHTVGPQMLAVPAGWLGADTSGWEPATLAGWAAALPTTELLVACLLCIPRCWHLGAVLAIGMHGGLLLVLGPFGLDHEPAVLIWNVYMATLAGILWWLPTRGEKAPVDVDSNDRTASRGSESRPHDQARRAEAGKRWPMGELAVAAAVCLPLLEPLGCWDHWLSWGLYSPRNGRVLVEVHDSALPRLPEDAVGVIDGDSSDGWHRVSMDAWSLVAVSAPIYPQARFQLGVALGLERRAGLDRDIRVTVLGMSDRWTGKRGSRVLHGAAQLRMEADRFWFNAVPR